MTRETYKSLSLIALFGLCTILVSLIWGNDSSLKPRSENRHVVSDTVTKKLSDIIYPQSYVVNFGGGSHTAMYYDRYGIWRFIRPQIARVLSEKTTEKPVTEVEWNEKKRFRSIYFKLPAPITPADYINISGTEATYSGKILGFDSVLIAASEPDGLYLADETNGQYYVIKGDRVDFGLENQIQQIERGNEPEYDTVEEHYRIRQTLDANENGTGFFNTVMVPRLEIPPMPIVRAKGELPEFVASEDANESIRNLADAAFGNEFAFVNRLVDVNGAVVFLYGYGERALRVHPNGVVEYQEKPDSTRLSQKTDMPQALRLSLSFIARTGGYPEGLYLTDYHLSENKQGYTFRFSYPLEGLPVVTSSDLGGNEIRASEPIVIQVEGEQVLSCQRRVGYVEGLLDVTPLWEKALTIDEVIVKNYERILPVYVQASGDTSMDAFIQYRLLNSIRSVRLVYCQNDSGDRMTPAWEVNFSGARFYFNVYDGRVMAAVQ